MTAVAVVVLLGGCSDQQADGPDEPGTGTPSTAPETGNASSQATDPGVVDSLVVEESPGGQPPGDQQVVLDALPGAKDATCAQVEQPGPMRSGAVGADFTAVLQAGAKGASSVSVPFIPAGTKGVRAAAVTFTSPSGSSTTVRSRTRSRANEWLYFPVRPPIDASGRWRVVARLGAHEGCFVVTVK